MLHLLPLVEDLSIRDALNWLKSMGFFFSIILEYDSLIAVNVILENVVDNSYFGIIVADCIS